MKNLRTLTLAETDNTPFIRALNPTENRSHTMLCPGLEEPFLYIDTRCQSTIKYLKEMSSERAKHMPSKLSSITIIGMDRVYGIEAILSLGGHVLRGEHKVEVSPFGWGTLFGSNGGDIIHHGKIGCCPDM